MELKHLKEMYQSFRSGAPQPVPLRGRSKTASIGIQFVQDRKVMVMMIRKHIKYKEKL